MIKPRRFGVLRSLCLLFAVGIPGLALAQSVFTHVHLRVPEGQQAQAAEWYGKVLGGEPGEIGPGPVIRYRNGFVGTMANEGAPGDSGESILDHVGIAVADVHATAELVRELGGEIRAEPQRAGPNGPMLAHVSDPWGGRFELVEDTDAPGVHHVHLFASDADATRDWLLQVFGGEFLENPGTPFHRIHYGNMWVHVTQAPEGERRQSSRYRALDHIGFRVPSLAEFRARLEATGYTPYLERPNPPGADLMFFEGPDGLHVEMTEPASR